ncbi:MAG TPA: CDF family Co(II)/Ni(II) efflux transporter DmeF [Stenotrophomonas sp.]|nr:CDF family Co(II)/Ni(II) efflux transporter DmeF [Stenotrophomonas sp.]
MNHHDSLARFSHDHDFLGERHERNARRTWAVVGLTAVMMIVEIAAGIWTGSMALLADGIHMSTHAGALAIAGFAYAYARRHRDDRRFTFGTGKVGDLAGFSSALLLGLIALGIAVESVMRLAQPVAIAFNEAIWVASLGLLVNLASAWMLGHDHDHGHGHGHDHHDHDHDHDHDHHHHDHDHAHDHHDHHAHTDHNLRSAYVHVLADALTSVLAIVALLLAKGFGWLWMDAAMGLVGALVIARWSLGLMRDTGRVLLDASAPAGLQRQIRERIEVGQDRVADLHVWRVGPGHHAAIISLVTHAPEPLEVYRQRLAGLETLEHLSIEVQHCTH